MKTLLRILPIFLLALVLIASVSRTKESSSLPAKPVNIYDTALFMLREFITEGPDSNLGFRNFEELNDIRIDTSLGISFYYSMESRLLADSTHLACHLVKMGRKIFPVFYHDQLRSAVTFDTTPYGWRPVIFDDADVIRPILANMKSSGFGGSDSVVYALYMMEYLHQEIAAKQTAQGDSVLPTPTIETSLAGYYPRKRGRSEFAPIGRDEFFSAVRLHRLKVHAERRLKWKVGHGG